jgi:CDP-diacylglycerol pyrophosphatase
MAGMVNVAALATILTLVLVGAATALARDRNALRHIVQAQCLPAYRQRRVPAPCGRLVLPEPGGVAAGYAVLKDRKGGAHYLLIPTRTISGIESAELLEKSSPNYIADAWHSRDVISHWMGRDLTPDAIGLAINPRTARGQDQLHIHMECVGPTLYRVLEEHAEQFDDAWKPLTITGRRFLARRLSEADLEQTNPLRLPSEDLPGAASDRGLYTLIVAGRTFASGPGFVVLAATGVPGGETLLDATCAVAQPASPPIVALLH